MYNPPALRIDDWDIIAKVIRRHSFVSLIGRRGDRLTVTKTPIILEGKTVRFHLARANELVEVIRQTKTLTILVDGPHHYISPMVYATKPEVPTWNYVLIQGELQADIVSDRDWIIRHHQELVDRYEHLGWKNELPDRYRDALHGMMVGVEAEIRTYEAKFKIGQDYADRDFAGIYGSLIAEDPGNELALLMRDLFPAKLARADG